MAHGMTRREFAMAAGTASLTGIGLSARTRASETKTLRFIAQSDLRVLDPIWTTAGITRNHGYMVYDTPFALDAKFEPQPQMVGDYMISPDKLRTVTPSARVKDRFIIVDAVGVCEEDKTDSKTLNRQHSATLEQLLTHRSGAPSHAPALPTGA